MIQSTFALLLLIGLVTFSSCIFDDPQPKTTRDFNLNGFTEVDLGLAMHIAIKKGTTFKITAEGEKDDVDDLILKVTNGKLTAEYKTGNKTHDRIELFIELPVLTSVNLHSNSNATLSGFKNNDQTMEIEASGKTKLSADLECKVLNLDISGAAEVNLKGKATQLDAAINGNSVLSAKDFPVENCDASVAGKSQATVLASKKLSGIVNGASKLTYYGNPVIVDVDVTSDSELIKK